MYGSVLNAPADGLQYGLYSGDEPGPWLYDTANATGCDQLLHEESGGDPDLEQTVWLTIARNSSPSPAHAMVIYNATVTRPAPTTTSTSMSSTLTISSSSTIAPDHTAPAPSGATHRSSNHLLALYIALPIAACGALRRAAGLGSRRLVFPPPPPPPRRECPGACGRLRAIRGRSGSES